MTTDQQPLGNVLAAIDFSAASEAVVERVATLPLAPGSSVVLLTVLPELIEPLAPADDLALQHEARAQLSAAVTRLAAALLPQVQVSSTLAHGTPFVEIIRQARAVAADLIVLGRHGHQGFADAVIGSTAERVLRKGDVATLIVAGAPVAPYRRPLVAVDGSDGSRRALALARRVVDAHAEPLTVLHARSTRNGDTARQPAAEIEAFLAPFGAQAATWRVLVCADDARAAILAEAGRQRADLLVLGTRGRSRVAHVLIGSVAEAVVRGAHCDVLVARPDEPVFEMP